MSGEIKGKYERKIVDSFEDKIIEGLFYLTLECGHKTVSKIQKDGSVFCGSCFQV